MNKLNKLQSKTEEIGVKNEYSKAVMESIKEDFLDLVDFSNKEEASKELAFYELQRVAKRTEVMFNLLGELMSKSESLSDELTKELGKMKRIDVVDKKLDKPQK